jgi:hypothetical protein
LKVTQVDYHQGIIVGQRGALDVLQQGHIAMTWYRKARLSAKALVKSSRVDSPLKLTPVLEMAQRDKGPDD